MKNALKKLPERARRKMDKLLAELREKRKELRCLYDITRIRYKFGTLDGILCGIVRRIPSAWQHPESACARIVLNGQEFRSAGFGRAVHRQRADLMVHGTRTGYLEVRYKKRKPLCGEGPFMRGERDMLSAIAERIGKIAEHKRSEEELRVSRRRLRWLFEHLQTVREEERKNIAYRIHDDLGQTLTALKIDARWLSQRLPKVDRALVQKMRSMEKLVDMAIQDVRRIASELRPVLLDDFGLTATIAQHAERIQKRTGLTIAVRSNPANITLDKERSIVMFRIFQELLTNVLRHAGAKHVDVELTGSARVASLAVRDDGVGIRTDRISNRSFGLPSIQERVRYWGGSVDISGSPRRGTRIMIRLPLKK